MAIQIQSRSQHSTSQHGVTSSVSIEVRSVGAIRSVTAEWCASNELSQGVVIIRAIVCPIKAIKTSATIVPFETALNIYTSAFIKGRSLGGYVSDVNIHKCIFYNWRPSHQDK